MRGPGGTPGRAAPVSGGAALGDPDGDAVTAATVVAGAPEAAAEGAGSGEAGAAAREPDGSQAARPSNRRSVRLIRTAAKTNTPDGRFRLDPWGRGPRPHRNAG